MTNDERTSQIRALLWEHARPTLRSMDRERIAALAEQIMQIAIDRGLWTKWGHHREEIAKRAADVWVPMEDLREALNALPGPELTKVDVEQRIRELREKPYSGGYPKREVEAEALAVFAEEKAKGTEFIAILGLHGGVALGGRRTPTPESRKGTPRADRRGEAAGRDAPAQRS